VPLFLISELRCRVMRFMTHDPHCLEMPDRRYPVNSVYFDTPHMRYYHEKIDGLPVRRKVRIRYYRTAPDEGLAYLEIKRKIHEIVRKVRVRVPFAAGQRLIAGELDLTLGGEPLPPDPAASAFEYRLIGENLSPVVLIRYLREAFGSPDDPGLRVTFDSDCRSAVASHWREFFDPADENWFDPGTFVLEVKFSGWQPVWLRSLIREFNLQQEAISKYCRGIDLWHPHFRKAI